MSRTFLPKLRRYFGATLLIGFSTSSSVFAQTATQMANVPGSRSADSAVIASLTSQVRPPRSHSSIFWSGAYPKPMIGSGDTTAVE